MVVDGSRVRVEELPERVVIPRAHTLPQIRLHALKLSVQRRPVPVTCVTETGLLRVVGLRNITRGLVRGPAGLQITSAAFGLARGRRGGKPKITEKEAAKAITDYQALALDLHPTLVLWQRVRELSNNLSVYDAHYVALAESFGVPLITSDARIERSGTARCTIETFEASST
jgi:predicted nucleic acid-binding protein